MGLFVKIFQWGVVLYLKNAGGRGSVSPSGDLAQKDAGVTGYAGVAIMAGELWSINRHLRWRYVLLCALQMKFVECFVPKNCEPV